MLVKLSGERYVATEHIESIEPIKRSDGYTENPHPPTHKVRMVSGDVFSITQVQADELLDAILVHTGGEL